MKKMLLSLLALGISSQSFAADVTCKLARYSKDGTISNLLDGNRTEKEITTETGVTRGVFKAKGVHGSVIVDWDFEQIRELTICSSASCSVWDKTTLYTEPGTRKVRLGLSERFYNDGTYAECVLD